MRMSIRSAILSRAPARALRILILGLSATLAAVPALSADAVIRVEAGKGVVFPQGDGLDTVFVADDQIADVTVSESNEVFVVGIAPGETTIAAKMLNGRTIDYAVVVSHNLTELRRSLAARFPNESVRLESARGSLFVSGAVSSDDTREAILETLRGAVSSGAVIDGIATNAASLVRLQLQLIEVNRRLAQTFGVDWSLAIAQSGFFASAANQGVLQFGFDDDLSNTISLAATIDFLITNGVASVVQETTITAASGQNASFQVGREIPLPRFSAEADTFQGANFSVDYRFFGTDLEFTPSILSSDALSLTIKSTISQLEADATIINGNRFPNTSTRGFDTVIQLENRQAFAIAGLSRSAANDALRDSTGTIASDVVNAVFGADQTTGEQQELVMVVTPYIDAAEADEIAARAPVMLSNLQHVVLGGRDGVARSGSWLAATASFAGFRY